MRARGPAGLYLACALVVIGAPAHWARSQTPGPDYTRQSDVIYGRKFGVALTLERFVPAQPNGLGILWVVSSGGRSSREQTLQPSFERRISPFLTRGYQVFAVMHGSAPVFHLQDFEQDVRRAVRFVRHGAGQLGIDPDRLALAGSSAGGSIALIVATRARDGDPKAEDAVDGVSDRVQTVGCFFAPTDFTNYGQPAVNVLDFMRQQAGAVDPTFEFYETEPKTGVRRTITDRDRILEILREMSPVTHVTSDDPPTILVHGDRDQGVPVQQSRQLVERLMQANVPARLVRRQGQGHAWPGWESDSALLAEWFDTHLRMRLPQGPR
jgi:acetyl esterase/lipase